MHKYQPLSKGVYASIKGYDGQAACYDHGLSKDLPVVFAYRGVRILAKVATQAVYGRRLRDQVYDLIKDDLKAGAFEPHQRFYEFELAKKYGVSRTPIREALFQLIRDGLLVSEERGYTVPVDTPKRFADRMEVHILLDPRVAYYAAAANDKDAVKALRKIYDKANKAHLAGKFPAYVDTVHQFRVGIRELCDNEPLRRCAMLIEDQFLAARNELFKTDAYREMDLENNGRLLAALEAVDPDGAEKASRDYMLEVQKLAIDSPGDFGTSEPMKTKRRPRQPREAS